MAKKSKKKKDVDAAGEPTPEKAKVKVKKDRKGLKRAAVGLLVVGVVGGGGFVGLQAHNARLAEAAAAVPFATGTEVAQRAYQAFRASGERVYEVVCPTVAEKQLGQETLCSGQDEAGDRFGIVATTVEGEQRFTFQKA